MSLTLVAVAVNVAAAQQRTPSRLVLVERQRVEDEFRLAAGFYEREQWQECVQALTDFIRRYPQTEEAKLAYFYLGDCHLSLGDLRRARGAYQTFILAHPNHALQELAVFRTAEILARLQDRQAARMLQNFLRNYPQSEYREYAWLYLGKRQLEDGDLGAALQAFESALMENPESALADDYRFGLACALQGLGQIEEAARFFQMLEVSDNADLRASAQVRLARIELDRGDLDAADQRLDRLLSSKEVDRGMRAEAMFFAAQAKIRRADEEAARDLFESSLQMGLPRDWQPFAVYELARLAFERQDFATLEQTSRTLVEQFPKSPQALAAVGRQARALFDQRRYTDLIAYLKGLDGKLPDWRRQSDLAELLGRGLYATQKHAEAAQVFERLLADAQGIKPEQVLIWKYFQAASLLGVGNFEAARRIIERLDWTALPDASQGKWHLLAGHLAVAAERFDAAAEHYGHAIAANGDAEDERVAREGLLKVRLLQGDPARVAEVFEEHFPGRPQSEFSGMLGKLANNLLRAKDYATAERLFTILAQPDADGQRDPQGVAGLGWLAFEQNHFDVADKLFREALDLDPESARRGDLCVALGRIAEHRQDWPQAADWYARAAASSSDRRVQVSARFKQAVALRKQNTDETAQTAAKLLSELAPRAEAESLRVHILYELSWLRQTAGDTAGAAALLEEIYKNHRGNSIWSDAALRLAQHLYTSKRFAESREIADELLSENPVDEIATRAQLLLGQIAVQQKQWAEAANLMGAVAEKRGDAQIRFQARYWQAEATYQMNDFARARDLFRALSPSAEPSAEKLAPWIELRTGQCAMQLADYPTAYTIGVAGQQKYAQFERRYEFVFLQGRAEFARGDLELAKVTFQRVVDSPEARQTETAAQSQWRIGEALFLQERFAEAIEAYYRVDSLYDFPHWRAAAMLQAGKCQERLRNYRQAMILYSNLLKKFPDSEFAEQARKRLSALERQVRVDRADKKLFR